MSTKSTTVRARLEPDLKKDAEFILEQLGISTTGAGQGYFCKRCIERESGTGR